MAMTASVVISISEGALQKAKRQAVLDLPKEVMESDPKNMIEWILANSFPKLVKDAIEVSPVRFKKDSSDD